MSGTALDLRKVPRPGFNSVTGGVLVSGEDSVRTPGREEGRDVNLPFLTVTGLTILAPPRPRPPLRFSFPLPALGILVSEVPPPLRLTARPPPPAGLHFWLLLVSSVLPHTLWALTGDMDLLGRLWDTTSLRDLNTGSGLLVLLVLDIFPTII